MGFEIRQFETICLSFVLISTIHRKRTFLNQIIIIMIAYQLNQIIKTIVSLYKKISTQTTNIQIQIWKKFLSL